MPAVDNEHAASTGLSLSGSARFLAKHPTARRMAHGVARHGENLLSVLGRYDIRHRTYYNDARRDRHPTVCTIVDMIPELLPDFFPVNPHQNKRLVAAESDLIFSISESTTRDILSLYDVDAGRVVTTPLGIEPSEFASPPTVVNPFSSPYVLFVGQRAGYKNFLRLAQAVVPLLLRDPSLSLALVGGGPLTRGGTSHLRGSRSSAARTAGGRPRRRPSQGLFRGGGVRVSVRLRGVWDSPARSLRVTMPRGGEPDELFPRGRWRRDRVF